MYYIGLGGPSVLSDGPSLIESCFHETQLNNTVNFPNSGHFGTKGFVLHLECPLLGSFVNFMLNDV